MKDLNINHNEELEEEINDTEFTLCNDILKEDEYKIIARAYCALVEEYNDYLKNQNG